MSITEKQMLIENSIAQKLKVYFFYDRLHRKVQPTAIGPHNGEMRMFGYQIGGKTTQQGRIALPGWRCFRLDHMTRVRNETIPSVWIEPPPSLYHSDERRRQQCINYRGAKRKANVKRRKLENDEDANESENTEGEGGPLYSFEDTQESSDNEYVPERKTPQEK